MKIGDDLYSDRVMDVEPLKILWKYFDVNMLLIFWSPLNPVPKIIMSLFTNVDSPSTSTPSLQKLKVFDFSTKMLPSRYIRGRILRALC